MFFRFGRQNKHAAQAQELKQRGDAALQTGDAEAAERHYRAALELEPRHGALLCNLGYALHGQGKGAEARLRLEQALERDPALADAHFLLARLMHGARELESADTHFRAALDLAPDHELAYFEYCHLLIEQNRIDPARQLMARALQHFPANADLHVYLGNLHFQAGDPAAAVMAFERGLALRGDDVAAMANLARVLLASGHAARAAEVARAALARAPQLHDVRLSLAQALERDGAEEEALAHYRNCLQSEAQAGEARLALARLLLRAGRIAEAQELGADPAVHFLVAQAMEEAGDIDAAMAGYRQALMLQDGHVASLTNLALLLMAQSQNDAALQLLRRAEREAPDDAVVQVNLGGALLALGELEEAIAAYRQAARLAPDVLASHQGLGIALLRAGRYGEAWDSAVRAAAVDAGNFDVLLLQGNILQAQGKLEEAVSRFEDALVTDMLHPNTRAGVYVSLGRSLQAIKRHDAALAAFRGAQSLRPDDRRLPLLVASALIQAGQVSEALAPLQRLIEADPADIDAHTLLGSALAELARFDDARVSYERSLALNPEHIDAKASHGLLCLLLGDFEHGWDGYCHLTQTTGMVPLPEFGRPLWQNDVDLAGKSLLLYADQGMGDAMQFVRYVERIAPLGATIHLAVQPALIGLMQTLPWPLAVVSKDAPLPATDFYCPLGHLPRAFATRLDSIPAPVPYLHAPPARAAYWRRQIDIESGSHAGLRIGLVWSGNPRFSGDRDRSIPFALIERLLASQHCRFHALQKDLRPYDAESLAAAQNIVDLGPRLADFTETAAIIANLDLVISVDTSVAHLAGAMGTPVWIMLPHSPDFRWLLERSDSPWYPSARLFRQDAPGDWAGVIERIAAALEAEHGR